MFCPQCNETRASEFVKGDKRCKACLRIKAQKYAHSKKGVVSHIYSGQKTSSKHRGHQPPTYTKQQLTDWLLGQPLFHTMFDTWVDSKYEKGLKPSCDRCNDLLGYSLSNIRLVTFDENQGKEWYLHKLGQASKQEYRPVIQYDLHGDLICEHASMNIASRAANIPQSNIWKCCNNLRYTAGGFKWEYKND